MSVEWGRMIERVRKGPRLRLLAISLVILVAVAVSAILEGDLPEYVRVGTRGLRALEHRFSYAPGFALLYIEESGVPLPAPGDVFVLYVGAHVPRVLLAWLAAWLGLIVVVVLGATNLFFVSRRWGTQLVHSQFAEYVHLNAERLRRAEAWFAKYGVLAIIFGRHIPGFRIPITVAAGVFRVRYPVFAACVAVSTAIWAGVVIIIGINYGTRLENFLRLHTQMYFVWGGIVVLLIVTQFIRSRRAQARARRVGEPVGR
jgi:membrane-associated protein